MKTVLSTRWPLPVRQTDQEQIAVGGKVPQVMVRIDYGQVRLKNFLTFSASQSSRIPDMRVATVLCGLATGRVASRLGTPPKAARPIQ